jgi:hypothetical protein
VKITFKKSGISVIALFAILWVVQSCAEENSVKAESDSSNNSFAGYYINGRVKDVQIKKGVPFKIDTLIYGGGIADNRINVNIISHLQAKLAWITNDGDSIEIITNDKEYFNLQGIMYSLRFTDDYDSSKVNELSKIDFYILLKEDKEWYDEVTRPVLSVDLPKSGQVSDANENNFTLLIDQDNRLIHNGSEISLDEIQDLIDKHISNGGARNFKIDADASSKYEMFSDLVSIAKENDFRIIIGAK